MANLKQLNVDQTDDLRDLVLHPGFAVLLDVVEGMVEDMELETARHPIATELDERELLRKKLRSEGAGRLLRAMKAQLTPQKAPGKKPIA